MMRRTSILTGGGGRSLRVLGGTIMTTTIGTGGGTMMRSFPPVAARRLRRLRPVRARVEIGFRLLDGVEVHAVDATLKT